MNFLVPGYVPPVDKNVKVPESITDHNQIKTTKEVYQLTSNDIKNNLKSLDKKVGDKLDGPDQVKISGPDQLEVNEAKPYDVAQPGDWIQATNDNVYLSNALTVDDADGTWVLGTIGVEANSNSQVLVKGRVEGNTILQNWANSSDPDKDITVVAQGTPISLEKFDIDLVDGKYPLLTWTTMSETNNDYFSIERSFDGISFEEIDKVPSKAENGTSRALLRYEYTDRTEGLHGDVFYRFAQVDKDGTKKTYEVKKVHIERNDMQPTLSPNRVYRGENVFLEISDKNHTTYTIINQNGQKIRSGALRKGTNMLDIAGLQAGIYFVQIKGSNTIKFVVE